MPSRIFSERPTRILRPDRDSHDFAVDAGAWSAKGVSRAVNEDNYVCASIGAPLLAAVADGMGGEAGGEHASAAATRSFAEALSRTDAGRIVGEPDDVLREALLQAHRDVLEEGRTTPGHEGMGTTLTAALVLWPRAHLVHVGDSRGYHLRHGALRQLTTDHTLAEVLIRRGVLSREAAHRSRSRHVLANHLCGDPGMPFAQSAVVPLEPGDAILLVTDGLSNALAVDEIAEIASRPCSAHAVCHMLVEAARAHGTRDDATAVLVRFGLPL